MRKDDGKLAMKRGRPSSKDAPQIERAILNAARELFATDGFDGVSMERVAAATGITRVTLYGRHPTKNALFQAVMRDMLAERFTAGDLPRTDGSVDIGTVLKRRVTDMASVLSDPLFRAFHHLILANNHRFPELGAMLHHVGYARAVDLLVNDMKAAAIRDGVPVRRPDVIAEHILTAIHGWFVQHGLVRDVTASDIETHGWGVVDLLLLSRVEW